MSAAGGSDAGGSAVPAFARPPPRLGLTAPADLDPARRALYEAITGGPRAAQAGTDESEALACRLARVMTATRNLPDEDYAAGRAVLGQERLAELTWLVGYYGALALALAVFRPVLPESFTG